MRSVAWERVTVIAAVVPAALGLAGLLLTNPHGEGLRVNVKGDRPFDDACLARWFELRHPTSTPGRGTTPSYSFLLPTPEGKSRSPLRVAASVANGQLDLTVAWLDGLRPPEALDLLLREVLSGIAGTCGLRSWLGVCVELSPGLECPALRSE